MTRQLRGQLDQIGAALGGLSNGSRRRGGHRAPQPFTLTDAKPKRTRRPITDPQQVERRRAALAKARAAREGAGAEA